MSQVTSAAKISGNPLALRESQWTAMHATPGTASASIAAPTTYAATEGFICIDNTSSTTNGTVWIKPSFIELTCTAAGTAGTIQTAQLAIDTINRYVSGGSALTQVSTSSGSAGGSVITDRTPAALSYAGALVLAAASTEKSIDIKRMRSVIPVVGDVYRFEFGEDGHSSVSTVDGTAVIHMTIPLPEVSIGPGGSCILRLVRASQSAAASFIVTVGWTEHGAGRFNG